MKTSQSFSNFGSSENNGGYQNGPIDIKSTEFKAQKEDFFSKKQAENAMRRDDLAPSQGGKYAGFGNNPNPPQNRGYNTGDYVESVTSGLTSSLSAFSLNASSLTGRVAEVGWKFTSLATQKAGELSETVTEKVKEGRILEDISSSASNIAGKVTEAVGKRNFDLSSLWSQQRQLARSDYQPCEDSGLLYNNNDNMGGYQDTLLSDRSPSTGREQDSNQDFRGFQNDTAGFQSTRKDSDDWGSSWTDGGWSEATKKPEVRAEKSKSSPNPKKTKSKKKEPELVKEEANEELLIDFGDSVSVPKKKSVKTVKKEDDGWGNWEDDAWESLNKND